MISAGLHNQLQENSTEMLKHLSSVHSNSEISLQDWVWSTSRSYKALEISEMDLGFECYVSSRSVWPVVLL